MHLFFDPTKHRPAPKMFGAALQHFLVNVGYVPYADDPRRYFDEIYGEVIETWKALTSIQRSTLGCRELPDPVFQIQTLQKCVAIRETFREKQAREIADLPHWWQKSRRFYS